MKHHQRWHDDPARVRPMLATLGEAPLQSGSWAYEPKYDGIRALIAIEPSAGSRGSLPRVRIWSRLGNEKGAQFPALVEALAHATRQVTTPLLVDGEIVALDTDGEPVGFQHLQRGSTDLAFMAFDLLRQGADDLRGEPLRVRRARLDAVWPHTPRGAGRLSEQIVGGGEALFARARQLGWEGIIAKRVDAPYATARRSPDWIKVKLVRHQTCVVGGWTEPRGARRHFGALLLGVYTTEGRLQYIGHTGTGFSEAELARVASRLRPLEIPRSPFSPVPKTNERPHWTTPSLVAEVKFTEWTADDKLRHPTYLGLRDDVRPETVAREPQTPQQPASPPPGRARRAAATMPSRPRAADVPAGGESVQGLLDQLDTIQEAGGRGVLQFADGARLDVTNLGKVFWPELKLTKGDLFRHYVRVAPVILPVLDGRPLVMKRYPNGIAGQPFYQHRATERIPAAVQVATVQAGDEERPHVIGGTLPSLLYTVQLGAISQDPWFSRVGWEGIVDHVALDLDPPDGMRFRRVLDLACWIRDELETLGAVGVPKTSGSGGLHVYVRMPPGTPYDAGLLYAQIVATMVARKHPKAATVERSIAARGNRIYVDYLQNIQGKTLASAYSVRANPFAGVSTPLTWDEVEAGVSPRDFTLSSFPTRLADAGDLWSTLRASPPADLRAVLRYAEPVGTSGASTVRTTSATTKGSARGKTSATTKARGTRKAPAKTHTSKTTR